MKLNELFFEKNLGLPLKNKIDTNNNSEILILDEDTFVISYVFLVRQSKNGVNLWINCIKL